MDMRLETERLLLRDFTEEDWPRVHQYASNEDAVRFMLWGPNAEEDTQAFIKRTLASYQASPRLNYEVAVIRKEDGRFIGGTGFHIDEHAPEIAELGYCYHPDYWGRGYASEAASALIAYGFRELGLHRIYAKCHPDNIGSAQVMRKVGMTYEGIMRQHVRWKGQWRDSLLYAVLASDRQLS